AERALPPSAAWWRLGGRFIGPGAGARLVLTRGGIGLCRFSLRRLGRRRLAARTLRLFGGSIGVGFRCDGFGCEFGNFGGRRLGLRRGCYGLARSSLLATRARLGSWRFRDIGCGGGLRGGLNSNGLFRRLFRLAGDGLFPPGAPFGC